MTLFVFFPLLPNGLCRIVPDERERGGRPAAPITGGGCYRGLLLFYHSDIYKVTQPLCCSLEEHCIYLLPLSKISSRLFIMVHPSGRNYVVLGTRKIGALI